jgi:hypothetical protein
MVEITVAKKGMNIPGVVVESAEAGSTRCVQWVMMESGFNSSYR